MSYEERGTWVYLVVTAAVYVAYVLVVLGRAVDPLSATPFRAALLWSLGGAVVASVAMRIVVEIVRPSDSHRVDSRDREIERLSDYRTRWFLIAGAIAGLVLALAQSAHFWIANAIYLGFVLQAVASSVVRLVAYRRGF